MKLSQFKCDKKKKKKTENNLSTGFGNVFFFNAFNAVYRSIVKKERWPTNRSKWRLRIRTSACVSCLGIARPSATFYTIQLYLIINNTSSRPRNSIVLIGKNNLSARSYENRRDDETARGNFKVRSGSLTKESRCLAANLM